jgi:sigma-B regulation protein RsbU (phosphoserine phosphatase)
MGKSEFDQVLEVIYRAILRETVSFNYYYRAGNDASLPDGVRGLLAKLAEEEREHRKILIREYTAIQKGWSGKGPGDEDRGGVSYIVPESPEFVSLKTPEKLDIKAVSLPARLVGGDHIFSRLVSSRDGSELGLFLTLYDAMGHGIETTRINSAAASILGEYLDSSTSADAEKEILSPSRAVNHLNAHFSSMFQGTGVFLTLFSAYFDLAGRTLNYTIAGHEPPIIVRRDGALESLYNTQLIIGIDEERNYLEHEVPFKQGDTLCLFSDGILEAQDPGGGFYGRQRLKDALKVHSGRSAGDTVLGVLEDLRNFCSGEPLKDELTIAVASCCSN